MTRKGFSPISDEASGRLSRINWQDGSPNIVRNTSPKSNSPTPIFTWLHLIRSNFHREPHLTGKLRGLSPAKIDLAPTPPQAAAFCATPWTSVIRPVSTSKINPRTGTSLAIHGCDLTFSICSRVFCSGSR
jgi:hypothetical protein